MGQIARRVGIRRPIIAAALLAAAASALAGLLQPGPWAIVALFVVAAAGAMTLDALGNIPFLRSVHVFERSEMTSVFRTYIEASHLLPALAYTAVLAVAPLSAVFLVLAGILFCTAGFALYLPKRL